MTAPKPAKRTLIHYSKAVQKQSMVGLFNKLRNKQHRHFCINRECRLYYDDHCDSPETNGRCQKCRGTTRGHTHWMDPVACCFGNTQQVMDTDELERYMLAGPGPWYQCLTCKRTHGHPCSTQGAT